ncbi:MAG: c-type cytochrome [Cyclobacteriaceae bacterium]
MRDLVALKGNSGKGKLIFEKLCATCHIVNDKGMGYGPEFSKIASKLMPTLTNSMSQEQLVDLVEYLAGLE